MSEHEDGHSFTHEEIAYGAFCIYEEERRKDMYSGRDAHWYMAIDRLKAIRADAESIPSQDPQAMSIELDAKNGVFMPDEGPGNRPRFAEFFRQVWANISPEQKDRILTYWRKFKDAPLIDLVERHRYLGENEDYGCRVKFNAQAVDWAPDDKLTGLIAHELGHVLSYADPQSASNKATGRVNIEKLNKIKEEEADALARSWGFDMTALRKWGNDNLGQFHAFGCDMPAGFTY